jgi:hypothetical protein
LRTGCAKVKPVEIAAYWIVETFGGCPRLKNASLRPGVEETALDLFGTRLALNPHMSTKSATFRQSSRVKVSRMKSRVPLPAEPWPRIVSVMLGLGIVALVVVFLLALAQSSHRTRAQDEPALVVPAAAEAPPVDPLFDVDRMERLLKRGEKPTQ